MPIKSRKENLKKIILITICFLFLSASYLFAADRVGELSSLWEQARYYRNEGVRMQDVGDLDSALKLYQKAAELDPYYQVVYNDLGIIYEAQGELDRAEESYLQALKIDPNFLDPYSNLALFYESKRDLNKAAFYWKKRLELGDPEDPWTIKAGLRLEDVQLALSKDPLADIQEKDVADLMANVSNDRDPPIYE